MPDLYFKKATLYVSAFFINVLVNLSYKERGILEEALSFRQVHKKFKLTEESQIAKKIYFIIYIRNFASNETKTKINLNPIFINFRY